MADVFISYKREDKHLVEALAAALEAEGLSVWWDTDLPLGKNFAVSISEELVAAKVVIPVWTARSVQSEWVQEEAAVGKSRGSLIPVRLEAVEPPMGFRMIQTADLSNWRPGDNAHPEWAKLTQSLRARISEPASAPRGQAPRAQAPASDAPPSRPPASTAPQGKSIRLGLIAAAVIAAGALGGGFYLLNQPKAVDATPAANATAQAAAPVEPAPQAEPAAQPATAESAVTTASAAPQGTPGEISYQTDQSSAVNDFVFSPDGTTALSAGNDGTVRLLDAATGKELKLFAGFGPRILQAVYSRTGSHLVIGAADSSVTFVEVSSGAETGRFETPADLFEMTVAPDDGSVAALAYDSTVRVYQADGVLLTKFTGKLSPNVYGIAWCPQSDCLLLWGKAGMLEVWDPFKPALVDSLRGHAGVVRAAAFSADGQRFATVADDKQILVWDANTGKRTGALSGLSESPLAVAWSRDGKRIAVETESGKAFVWNAGGGAPIVVGAKYGIGKGWLAFTPDGKSVVLGGGGHGPVAVRIPD